jgi:hypothetical protein
MKSCHSLSPGRGRQIFGLLLKISNPNIFVIFGFGKHFFVSSKLFLFLFNHFDCSIGRAKLLEVVKS